MTIEVFLALGSNLGDRAEQLQSAIAWLENDLSVSDRSPVYETKPLYLTDQPEFLNMVVRAETGLSAFALLRRLQACEKALGRVRGERFGPRAIDLDILYFGDAVIQQPPELVVPHPRIAERRFVLQPLNDIAPNHRDPVSGRSVTEMLAALPASDEVRPFAG